MPNHFYGIIVVRDFVGAGSSRPDGDIPDIIKTGRDDRAPTYGIQKIWQINHHDMMHKDKFINRDINLP